MATIKLRVMCTTAALRLSTGKVDLRLHRPLRSSTTLRCTTTAVPSTFRTLSRRPMCGDAYNDPKAISSPAYQHQSSRHKPQPFILKMSMRNVAQLTTLSNATFTQEIRHGIIDLGTCASHGISSST